MTCTIERIHPLDFRSKFWNLQRLWKQHEIQLEHTRAVEGKTQQCNKRSQKLEDILQRNYSMLFLSLSGVTAERKAPSPQRSFLNSWIILRILTEMDGFEGNSGVIVVAATNRADILDNALLRPGRFDRRVTVGLPDVKGREQILNVHVRNKKLAEGTTLTEIAKRSLGREGVSVNMLQHVSPRSSDFSCLLATPICLGHRALRNCRLQRCRLGESDERVCHPGGSA